jgi:hypothetical protein
LAGGLEFLGAPGQRLFGFEESLIELRHATGRRYFDDVNLAKDFLSHELAEAAAQSAQLGIESAVPRSRVLEVRP